MMLSLPLSLLLSLSLARTDALSACFTESPFASTCEPATSVASIAGIRGCFRPDQQTSDDSAVSVVWNASTGVCERRSTSCGNFAACSGRCLVSCDVATRGFLVLSLRAAVGMKFFTLIETPASSNGSVIGMFDAAHLPPVFRANVLDQLPNVVPLLTFKEMVVSLFVNDSVVVNVTFDLSSSPSGLDRTSWFSKERLKACWPVTDLWNRTFNFFSISGDTGSSVQRRMFINYNYGGCPADAGLMVVLDTADACSWTIGFTTAPRILYTTQPGVPYASGALPADKFAITVR